MLTAQVEPWAPFIEEAKSLLPLHWEELALDKEHVPLEPMWEVYDARDAAGQIMVVTLREAGRLVGYFIGCLAPGLHYRTCLTLQMDIFFVHPDHRGHMGGVKLFKAVEREARRRGVNRLMVASKLHRDSSRLFTALGYAPIETHFSKWLGPAGQEVA
ncbi:GNAT family N-acetyltransferase [Sphingomonas histidinilytica]|uniref:GNAT family N-acetyltransferase n=1 Tax=Rhizorhabdus histidinilytica TaxID=439228 RepID=UPI001ADA25C3|nr:GNAT family N-acetyltransferase [Rhizorhabdus histidinilytica]MBO9377433.1 GNAT family N-acetyltransferase [Rhizorhabdus histidinilytica]